MRKKSKKQI
jgi:hypothetical protein